MNENPPQMRHPRTFRVLFWFGSTLCVGAVAVATLLVASAGTFEGVKAWVERSFYEGQPILSAPKLWTSVALFLVLYVIALAWTGLPPPARERLRRASLKRKEEVVLDILSGRHRNAADAPPAGSPIVFAGLEGAKDTPIKDHTAVRVVVRNQSSENREGLVARLVAAKPALDGLEGAINLPLVLETKDRLDRYRNPAIAEPFPPEAFNLHAHSDKSIEIVWLHSKGALEGHITHEAGEASFLFVGTQELRFEVTGAGPPIAAVLRIDVADDDLQSWKPALIVEAAAHMHGQGNFG